MILGSPQHVANIFFIYIIIYIPCSLYRYGVRGDCGCNYRICVRLLDGDKEELDKWEFNDTKDEGQDWTKVRLRPFKTAEFQTWQILIQ